MDSNVNLFTNIRTSLVKIGSILELQELLPIAHHRVLTRDALNVLMSLKYKDQKYTFIYPRNSNIYAYMPKILQILYTLHLIHVASKRIDTPYWPHRFKVEFKLTSTGLRYVNTILPKSNPNIREQQLKLNSKQDNVSQIQTDRDYVNASSFDLIVPTLISGSGILLGGLMTVCENALDLTGVLLIIGSISFYIWTLISKHKTNLINKKSDQDVSKLEHQMHKIRANIDKTYQHIYTHYDCSLLGFILLNNGNLSNAHHLYGELYNWIVYIMFRND